MGWAALTVYVLTTTAYRAAQKNSADNNHYHILSRIAKHANVYNYDLYAHTY